MLLAGDAYRWAVTLLTVAGSGVDLHQHAVVHIASESPLNSIQISIQAVTGKLNAIRQTSSQITHKDSRGNAIARSNDPRWNQLTVRSPLPRRAHACWKLAKLDYCFFKPAVQFTISVSDLLRSLGESITNLFP